MKSPVRNTLLISALILGGLVSIGIMAFGLMAEPEEFSAYSAFFAILIGVVTSSPLWLPAIIPSRFKVLSGILRWLGAIALIFPAYISSGIIINFISRAISDRGPSFMGLILGVVLTGLCLLGIVILIWPELRRGYLTCRSSGTH